MVDEDLQLTPEQMKLQIQFLESQLAIERFLNRDKQSVYDGWERALRHYASGSGDKSPTIAREALGVCEYWDAGFGETQYGKYYMKMVRLYRRIKERFKGPCC